MRLGVLDVGSNTVHLLVVDAYSGARPMPAFSHKVTLKLAAQLDGTSLSGPGEKGLREVVEEALRIAEDKGVEEIIAFATSAVREAVNGEQVLARIREQTGTQINVMTGQEEARLTFLAARRWFGWSSGRLLVIDIGGGSLEVASGIDEEPDALASLPLGAGRLTRDWLSSDPPSAPEVRRMRRHVRAEIARQTGGMLRHGAPDQVVGTSKTFRQLARIGGAAPSGEGPYVKRVLQHADVAALAERLPTMTQAERLKLPGVSASRVAQLPAGAIVADAILELLGVDQLEQCPWALREGVILRRLDTLAQGLGALPQLRFTSDVTAASVVPAGHEADPVGVILGVDDRGADRRRLLGRGRTRR
jgi:exopolyphosphatase / guanosine-5'-triphosphate,3'-diphosphate pyrophosphatase